MFIGVDNRIGAFGNRFLPEQSLFGGVAFGRKKKRFEKKMWREVEKLRR
jgi:hypothetical protein